MRSISILGCSSHYYMMYNVWTRLSFCCPFCRGCICQFKYRRNVMLSFPAVLLGNMGTIFWLTRHIKIAQLTEPKRRKFVAVVMSHRRLPALVPFDESKARA